MLFIRLNRTRAYNPELRAPPNTGSNSITNLIIWNKSYRHIFDCFFAFITKEKPYTDATHRIVPICELFIPIFEFFMTHLQS